MKRNIILLYLIYAYIMYLLLLIDIGILMYYIFWINNIFFYPLFWLWVKIIYYNRTILLLLLFYYFIAKFTIKEMGYKYYLFFNIDVRKWRSIYLNYIWNITIYHIEMVSIYLFFFVITLPLLIYKKEIYFFLCVLIIFFLLLIRIMVNRLNYMNNINMNKKNFFLSLLLLIFFVKYLNYPFIKDLSILYLHLDVWAFDLLELKINMYEIVTEKDYFSKTVGLKPIWVGNKIVIKDLIEKKYWDYLYKKKKKFLIKELKYIIKKKEKKYLLYNKYFFKVLEFKKKQLYFLKKYYIKKKVIDKEYKVKIKEFSWIKINKDENPVITQEKEKERELHRVVISNKIFKFSIKNYYFLNLLLKNFTFDTLYYHSFLEKENYTKYLKKENKQHILNSLKEPIYNKEDFSLFKEIIKKIKTNKKFLKKNDMKNIRNDDKFTYNKLIDYTMNEKKKDSYNLIDYIIKKLKNKEIIKKKKKYNMSIFLKKINNEIEFKSKANIFFLNSESNKNIIKNDTLKEKNKGPYTLSCSYVNKRKIDRFDNRLIFHAVNKYNEEDETKIKKGFKSEFYEVYLPREKKGEFNINNISK